MSAGVARFLAEAAAFQQLQSSGHFGVLSVEISGAELKIAAARRFLNATVAEYNAALRQFPAALVARRLELYCRRPYYDIGVERVLLDDAPALPF